MGCGMKSDVGHYVTCRLCGSVEKTRGLTASPGWVQGPALSHHLPPRLCQASADKCRQAPSWHVDGRGRGGRCGEAGCKMLQAPIVVICWACVSLHVPWWHHMIESMRRTHMVYIDRHSLDARVLAAVRFRIPPSPAEALPGRCRQAPARALGHFAHMTGIALGRLCADAGEAASCPTAPALTGEGPGGRGHSLACV